jgi:hypothetical protein
LVFYYYFVLINAMSCWEGEAWRETRIRERRIIYSVQIEICEIVDYDTDLTDVLKEKLALPKSNIKEPIYLGDLPFPIRVNDDDPSDDSWVNQLKS